MQFGSCLPLNFMLSDFFLEKAINAYMMAALTTELMGQNNRRHGATLSLSTRKCARRIKITNTESNAKIL